MLCNYHGHDTICNVVYITKSLKNEVRKKQMKNIEKSVFIAPSADVLGDVTMKEDASIWFHATVRADADSIYIGRGSNIQDNCVLHVDRGYPVRIGEYVTVGHGAVVHGCTIGDHSLIGMGAILLNGCKIGKNCIVGAGALVTGGMEIPDGSVVLGNPGKIKRGIREEEITHNIENARLYIEEAKTYLGQGKISDDN